MKKYLRAFISGKVQGVFFRVQVKQWADELGLKGWVRNLDDGKVEVVAEGADKRLRTLEKLLRQGPPGAKVKGVEAEYGNSKGGFKDFRITY